MIASSPHWLFRDQADDEAMQQVSRFIFDHTPWYSWPKPQLWPFHFRKNSPITLILLLAASVDPPRRPPYPKTTIVLHLLFNNSHNLNIFNPLTLLKENCVLVTHQLSFCSSSTSRIERSKCCSLSSSNCQKDGHFVLSGIYLVAPAAAKGGIFPSVTLK